MFTFTFTFNGDTMLSVGSGRLLSVTAAIVFSGCTSFGAVRSAEVIPGPSLMQQLSVTSPPGENTSWFWSHHCEASCNRSIPNFDLGVTLGRAALDGDIGYAIGVGWSGIVYPYADGYVQLRTGRRPYGAGARVGIPVNGWNEYQVARAARGPPSGSARS